MIEAALILWDIALPKLDGLTGQGGLLARVKAKMGSLILCVISLTYIGAINLCVLCVFVVRSTRWVHLIFVNLPIGIFTGKLSAKIRYYFRFYHSIPAFGGFYPQTTRWGRGAATELLH